MKSIIIIGCYFGKLREDTPMFLKSIEQNPTINWLIISDCSWKEVPSNMQVVNMSFEELSKYIQGHFDFQIALSAPYKLCDLRPAYGLIFQEYISEYDFWGHCDFDMLFGNLRDFFTEQKLETYDRIYCHGHLSVYKNCERINRLFMSKKGHLYYQEVFSDSKNRVFDEIDGMYHIFEAENVPIYKEVEYADIFAHMNVMFHTPDVHRISKSYPCNFENQVFVYEQGHIYKYYLVNRQLQREEYAYIHYSHKVFKPIDADRFYITSSGYITLSNIQSDNIPFQHYHKGVDDFKMKIANFRFRVVRKLKNLV